MKFAVKAWSNRRARAGSLQLGSVEIETPSLLLSTRKGLPRFISPDLLPSLPSPDFHLLQFSPLHFLDKIGGIHQMLGLHGCGFVAVARDSSQCLPLHDGANKAGPSFETPWGRRLIKPVDYMEMISSMRPNIWATLADEVPAWVSEKWNTSSVDRTVKWLDECMAISPMDGEAFGAIVGGSNEQLRQYCAEEVAKRNVSEEVLQGVAAGIDLFDSTYIHHITNGGSALTFPLDGIEAKIPTFETTVIGRCLSKINLRATVYRKDTTPIVEGCSCYTCRNYTKAYINHLLNVHEMLAQTLLELHNTHCYLGFFRLIRESIKEGKFERFHKKFNADRDVHLASSAVYA